MNRKPHILLSALDWGTGHLTRCIPLINYLQNKPVTLTIAANSAQKTFLQQEGIECNYINITSYNIKYGNGTFSTTLLLFLQIPKSILSLYKERKIVEEFCANNSVDCIISDNRFGFRHPKIYSIFITHQVNIKSPFLRQIAQYINHWLIKKFDSCWIPDILGEHNLSGDLSHPLPKNINAKYIGWLSRFSGNNKQESQKKILAILSGPEPQKSILANTLAKQFSLQEKYQLVIAGTCTLKYHYKQLVYLGLLNTSALEKEIADCAFVVSRSGYTTVMDLIKCRKKAILIPTLGQTEQLYLSELYLQRNYFVSLNHLDEDILSVIHKLEQTSFNKLDLSHFEHYKQELDHLIDIITKDARNPS